MTSIYLIVNIYLVVINRKESDMGFVRVELPFEGLECDHCIFETSVGSQANNYCELFCRVKAPFERCAMCVESELRVTYVGKGELVNESVL